MFIYLYAFRWTFYKSLSYFTFPLNYDLKRLAGGLLRWIEWERKQKSCRALSVLPINRMPWHLSKKTIRKTLWIDLGGITPNHYQVIMNMIWFSFSFLLRHIPRFPSHLKGKRVQFKFHSFLLPLTLGIVQQTKKNFVGQIFSPKWLWHTDFFRQGFVDRQKYSSFF